MLPAKILAPFWLDLVSLGVLGVHFNFRNIWKYNDILYAILRGEVDIRSQQI